VATRDKRPWDPARFTKGSTLDLMRHAALTTTLFALLPLIGCGPADPVVPANVALTADAIEAASHESGLLLSVVRGLDSPRAGADRLGDAIDRVDAQLSDFYGRCATTTRVSPGVLRVALRSCQGRLGLRNVTGELQYNLELVGAAELRVNVRIVSAALRVNTARITQLDVTALFRRRAVPMGFEYTTTVEQSAYTTVGTFGQYVHREVSAVADVPVVSTFNTATSSYTLQGAWRVTMGPTMARARAYRVVVSDYRRFFAQCPQPAEDAVTLTDLTPGDGGVSSFIVSFSGGSTAAWRSTNPNASGVLTLSCSN
jgi:hypothetical protein